MRTEFQIVHTRMAGNRALRDGSGEDGGREEDRRRPSDGFLEKMSGLMNKENVTVVLSEQEHM